MKLIDLSLVDIVYDEPLLTALLPLWSYHYNCFILPLGPMSLTLRDVTTLTSLPIHGETSPALAAELASTRPIRKSGTSFVNFISLNARKGDITNEEYILFLWDLISKFIIYPPSGKPSLELLPITKVVPYLPILLSSGPAFADRMRCTLADDIRHMISHASNSPPLQKTKPIISPSGVKINMPQSSAKAITPPQ
ncbi:hypothetical protein GH714_007632 [Hevea brasiliensis]|uniref:Aminotransferase-like plant mobile domain-containing protein n=1 Tax=Hevea brasiliensis TaxID=3981 RepID=A0A6A6N2S8_HEVBR|nr:hypothetical protein GH714_007632 [Hevea brasiliensis]